MSPVLDVQSLAIAYRVGTTRVQAVDGVDLQLHAGESLGIVGESGSGKSTLGMAIGRLLAPNARIEEGDVRVEGVSVARADATTLRRLRRERLGFVYQNPMSALDPTMRIGRQLALLLEDRGGADAIRALLERVGLPAPDRVAASFPHQLSGGMAQRVVIALAIARAPAILVADEPTASLDATIKGAILDLLDTLRAESGSSLVLLSHDLRTVARRCDRVAVMYGGRIVETGASARVFESPRHPYTRALLRAAAGQEHYGQSLEPIAGVPPVLHRRADDCPYAPRCDRARADCRTVRPRERLVDDRVVACHHAEEERPLATVGAAR